MTSTNPTIPIFILSPGGPEQAPVSARSLFGAAELEPPGVYTVTRTYHGDKGLLLDRHFDRLEKSAKGLGVPLHLDRKRLRAGLRECINAAGFPESRFRITVPLADPDKIYIAIEPFNPPSPELIEKGVRAATVSAARERPDIKRTDWMQLRRRLAESLPPGIYEGLLTGADGQILEGFSSNFYAVLNGVLRTADEGVLHGIARAIVLKIADGVLPVELRPVSVGQIPMLSEAMLSSSSRGVVPIVEINGIAIGDGRPGPIARALRARYDAWAEAHLEPI